MRRDISIITERAHLSTDSASKAPAMYSKGAAVTLCSSAYAPSPRPLFKDRFNKQWNASESVTGARLRAVANKARQRRKGPIVRFGGRVYK